MWSRLVAYSAEGKGFFLVLHLLNVGYQGAEIVLDEVPFGTFMEIEAPREVIRSMATALGLDFEARLVSGYGKIFDAVRSTYNLAVTDMTFEAFRSLDIDLRACHLH